MNEGPYANGGENTNIYRSMQRILTTFINSRPFSVLSRPIQYIHDSAWLFVGRIERTLYYMCVQAHSSFRVTHRLNPVSKQD